MKANNRNPNASRRGWLGYVLDDFLELKALLNRKKRRPLKKFLLSQACRGGDVSLLEGVQWARSLVMISHKDPDQIDQLVFVSPEEGRVHIRKFGQGAGGAGDSHR